MPGPGTAGPAAGRWPWLRGALSLGLLVGLVVFAWRSGTLLRHLEPGLLARVAGLALASALLNGGLLCWLGRGQPPPAQPLAYGEALRVSSLGSFANAAGGLPIGTVLVFGTLLRRHRISLAGVAMGKALGAVLNIGWMLLIVAIGVALGVGATGQGGSPSASPSGGAPLGASWTAVAWGAGLAGGACLGLPPLVGVLGPPPRWRAIDVFRRLVGGLWVPGLLITGAMAACNVGLYATVVHHYLPAQGWGVAIGWAAATLGLGFLLGVNNLGGAQEIIAGLSGLLFRLPGVVGVELALVVRLGTILATGALAGWGWWRGRHRRA